MPIQETVDLIANLGFPAALLVVTLYLISRSGKWLISNVVEPVTKTHLEFVSFQQEQTARILDVLEQQVGLLGQIKAEQVRVKREHKKDQDRLYEIQEEITSALALIQKHLSDSSGDE